MRFKKDSSGNCIVKASAARIPPAAAEKNRLFKGQI